MRHLWGWSMGDGHCYDLADRMLQFAKRVMTFVQSLQRSIPNDENCRQLVRAAGSVGANYIEVNESLGRKDFLMRIRISKKESKESRYWLQLMECPPWLKDEQGSLIQESTELMNIFGAILRNSVSMPGTTFDIRAC